MLRKTIITLTSVAMLSSGAVTDAFARGGGHGGGGGRFIGGHFGGGFGHGFGGRFGGSRFASDFGRSHFDGRDGRFRHRFRRDFFFEPANDWLGYDACDYNGYYGRRYDTWCQQ
jgi:hypothetical protein